MLYKMLFNNYQNLFVIVISVCVVLSTCKSAYFEGAPDKGDREPLLRKPPIRERILLLPAIPIYPAVPLLLDTPRPVFIRPTDVIHTIETVRPRKTSSSLIENLPDTATIIGAEHYLGDLFRRRK